MQFQYISIKRSKCVTVQDFSIHFLGVCSNCFLFPQMLLYIYAEVQFVFFSQNVSVCVWTTKEKKFPDFVENRKHSPNFFL